MALRFLLSGMATLVLFALFTGLGSAALSIFRLGRLQGVFWLLVRIGLGFGITGNVLMLLCFLRVAHPPVIIGFLCLTFLATLPFLKTPLIELSAYWNPIRSSAFRHPFLSGACVFMLVGYLVLGLFPPTGFDALMYHLSVPKLYVNQGGFWNVFFNPQSDYPMLTEMIYMIGIALGNDSICTCTSYVIGLLLVCAIAYASRRFLQSGARELLWAVLVFGTSTSVIAGWTACNVDMAQALWTLLAVFALERYLNTRGRRYLVVCALFAGMALETKIFGIFVLPVLCVRLIADSLFFYFRRGAARPGRAAFSRNWIPCIVIIVIALLVGAPWYLKALCFKGTILSLSHESIEGQGLATPMNIHATSLAIQTVLNTVVRIVTAPWTFSLFPGQHQGDTFGPLFIAVLPFLLLTGAPRKARFLLGAAGAYWVSVLLLEMLFVQGGSSIRYSTFIIAVGAAFIPWTVFRLRSRFLRSMTALMMLSMVVLGMVLFVKRYHHEWNALITGKTRDAYYSKVIREYTVIAYINGLTDGKTVMPVYNFSDYLINVPYVTAYRTYRNPAEMRADLLARNVGYIFANNRFDTTENRRAFPELMEKTCVAAANGFYVYKLAF